MYSIGGRKFKPGVETKWGEGILLDLVDLTNEYVIGTPAGIIKAGSIKRMTKDNARDPTLFKAIVGSLWKLTPTSEPGTSTDELPDEVECAAGGESRGLTRAKGACG